MSYKDLVKRREYITNYRVENREKLRERRAKHYAENRAKVCKQQAEYRASSEYKAKQAKYRASSEYKAKRAKYLASVKGKAAQATWHAANVAKIRELERRRYAANPEKGREKCRKWRANINSDPNRRLDFLEYMKARNLARSLNV